MHKCSKCWLAIIITKDVVIRACPETCKNEPIVAEMQSNMAGIWWLK